MVKTRASGSYKNSFLVLTILSIIIVELSWKVCAGKVLVLQAISSKSHKITYMTLIEELASRGHQIKIVSPVKPFKTIENVTEVYTFDMEAFFSQNFNPFELKELNKQINPVMMVNQLEELCRMFHDLPQVRQLLDEKFDLLFFQPVANECILGFVHKLNTPFVLFSPISAPFFLVSFLGGHHPNSFSPNVFLGYSDHMNFYERVINFGVNTFFSGVMNLYMGPKMTAVYREKLGDPGIPSTGEVLAEASLILNNGHFALNYPKPNLPDVIDVGGIHSKPAKPLPKVGIYGSNWSYMDKDLEEFINVGGNNGFILFSMGTVIKENLMPESKRVALRNVFAKLKQQVIWKWDSDNMTDLPKNVRLSKWLPQQDLLGHPGIKMFITHCGGGGSEEAIYHGVPLVGIPMLGDQILNAQQAKKQGYLVELDWNDLTEDTLFSAVNEVLDNPSYRTKVKQLSTLFRDQPGDPLERGVYWVEYVMRHKGAPQLRSAARKLNYIQYHSIDVILVYLSIIIIGLYLTKTLLGAVYRLVTKILFSSHPTAKVSPSKSLKKQN